MPAAPPGPAPEGQTRTALWRAGSLGLDGFVCTVGPHRHAVEEASTAHLVVFVRSGAFVRTIGRESQLADPTHVLFFTRAEPYRVTHPAPGGDRCTIVTVSAETLLEIGRRPARGRPEDPDAPFAGPHALATPRAVLLHRALLSRLQRGEIGPLELHELTLELLDEVLAARERGGLRRRPGPLAPVSARARDLAEAARATLAARYPDPPSLDDLARALGCSPFHLSRSFSRAVGIPLRRYLDRLRLRLALERLAGGERDLTALALDLGYADHSHFTNAFRREFGGPPSTWRPAASRPGPGGPPGRRRPRGDGDST